MVAPVWIQEAIVMHLDPSFEEPYEGPFAEIILTVIVRCRPGDGTPDPEKGDCDFSFLHPGRILGLRDVFDSFREGPYHWVNKVTPETPVGVVKRGMAVSDGEVSVTLEPLDARGSRFDLESPVQCRTVKVETVSSALPEGTEKPILTQLRARPKCPKCSGHGGCRIARIRFTADEGIEEGNGCATFPAHGPEYVCQQLRRAIRSIPDRTVQEEMTVQYRHLMFDENPAMYDLAWLLGRSSYRYEIATGQQYQKLPPFFVERNGDGEAVDGSKKLVHYCTPALTEGNFMITALAEKLVHIETEQERAIRLETEFAAKKAPLSDEALAEVKNIVGKLGDLESIG